MILSRLKLANFKNYAEADISLSNNVNCFVGNNGVGKTNLLDAIYYLSFCKSYFNPIDSQNIRHGADFFAIHGDYVIDGDNVMVSCTLKKGQNKQMKYNKKTCSSLSEHIGRIPLVIVSPNDQQLILGGSEVRRKFIDGVISQADHTYLNTLLQYNKALDQRNHLLKTFYENRYFDKESIALWDEQLARFGSLIYLRRQQFVEQFRPLFTQYFTLIASDATRQEEPRLYHQSPVGDNLSINSNILDETQLNHIEQHFLGQLNVTQQRDAVLQYTTFGVHKDDIELTLGTFPVKKYGSQGQQKTFLLALKLAQFDYIGQRLNTKPILLLDDIFDKLDMLRVKQLVRLVGSNRFGQVFITDTQQGRVESIFEETPSMDHLIFQCSAASDHCGHISPNNNDLDTAIPDDTSNS